jgi:hypothetical protein
MSRRQRLLLLLLAGCLLLTGLLALRAMGVLDLTGLADVKPLAEGHQELAFLGPATSGENWERLVAAVQLIEKEWPTTQPGRPPFRANYDNAFPPSTIDVPEIRMWLGNAENNVLWVRWYKLSSELDAGQWLSKLARRGRPPLAVIGGETSNQALLLAQTLHGLRNNRLWQGAAPLLLITHATADRYNPSENLSEPLTDPNLPRLLDVYKGNSYRFSFTNSRMAEAVIDFLAGHPQVWSRPPGAVTLPAGVVAAGAAGPWGGLALLESTGAFGPHALYAVAWADDRYSLDLADRFGKVFTDHLPRPEVKIDTVQYGVGLADQPNPSESEAAYQLLASQFFQHQTRQALALPTSATHARRFLRTLARQAPLETSRLVVLSGGSISFDSLLRDRLTAWNVQDVPASLICFCHRDPVDPSAGFRPAPTETDPVASTGTNILLLYRDILEGSVLACSDGQAFVHDGKEFHRRVADLRWFKSHVTRDPLHRQLFAEDGNRHARTGERIVWLRPFFDGARVLPQADLIVWWIPRDEGSDWRPARELLLSYNSAPGGAREK